LLKAGRRNGCRLNKYDSSPGRLPSSEDKASSRVRSVILVYRSDDHRETCSARRSSMLRDMQARSAGILSRVSANGQQAATSTSRSLRLISLGCGVQVRLIFRDQSRAELEMRGSQML
jgi:hypothetical protein